MGKTQYDTRTDAVIYGCDETADFTADDWQRLAAAALDQAGVRTLTANRMGPRATWRTMYHGALVALRVQNVDMAGELAELTRSDEEAEQAIRRLSDEGEGDRVHPVLEWLRRRRVSP